MVHSKEEATMTVFVTVPTPPTRSFTQGAPPGKNPLRLHSTLEK